MQSSGPETIKPYDNTREKTAQVEEMFDSIAPAYDFMNRAMTMGIDRLWRRKGVNLVAADSPKSILDVAAGTADMSIALARRLPQAKVTGIDLSEEMLAEGRVKVGKAGLGDRVTLLQGDCLHLPMADGEFDAVTVVFGVRNFENLLCGYR